VLRDVVAAAGVDLGSAAFATAADSATASTVSPFVDTTIAFGRRRKQWQRCSGRAVATAS